MKSTPHLSDDDLRLVVQEQPTQLSQDLIESHVSECLECQERLLSIAADADWRAQFSSSIVQLKALTTFEETDTREFRSDATARVGDDFDLETVDQMLKAVLQTPSHPEMLGRLGRYEVEGVVGCGGMGVVLRGYDCELRRPVAIKLVLPRLMKNGPAKQRFLREARAAAAVLHPNVIAIHDIDETGGVPWFVMPLVVGPSLKALVDQRGPLPERELVRIGMQIASGLAAAHSQGLVHRDIKPENILVDNQVNRVVITDFGLARRECDQSMTQTGWLAGSLNYMSPEQSRGEELDARSDLFSLGSLLFFLATGDVPFRADAMMGVLHRIGNEAHPNVQTVNPEVSQTFANVIDRLLEKSPSCRFQTAVETEAFLNDYLVHLHQPSKTPAPKIPTNSSPQKTARLRRWFGRTAACAAIALAGWWGVTAAINWNSRPLDPPTLWSDIKERYQLKDQATFDKELLQLQQEITQADSLFEDPIEAAAVRTGRDLFSDEFTRDLLITFEAMNNISQKMQRMQAVDPDKPIR